ncbi:cytochrome P450 [Nocardia vulneris]|uniref:cytochrome P450 n=1 Tax=Nocardia vulneris TaxID=1141657 RepID=UPI0030CFC176
MAVPSEIGGRRAVADRDWPSALVARARRRGGIMRVRVPMPGRAWLVADGTLVDQVLRTGAGDFDKGGPIYRIIRKATGDEGLFAVDDPWIWRRPSFPLIFRHVAVDTALGGRQLRPGDQLFLALGPGGHPFGVGKRKCVGEPLARLTGILAVAVLVQRFPHWRRVHPHSSRVRYATTGPPRDSGIYFSG